MILVVGGSGRVGGALVAALERERRDFRLLVRDRRQAAGRPAAVADLDRPETLPPALVGAERVFLLTPACERQIARECALIDAARVAGVERLVKLSWTGAAPDTPVPFGKWHWAIEEHLRGSGLPFTIVRAATFMQHLIGEIFAPQIRTGSAFAACAGDGRVALVDVRDVADIAVEALLRSDWDRATFEVTGPEALDFATVAAKISQTTGRRIRYLDLPPEQVRRRLLAAGYVPWFVEAILDLFAAYRDGAGAALGGAVQQVLGRTPIPLSRFAAEHRLQFEAGR